MDKLLDQFSFGLFFWQALLFIGLLLLLRKFAWKPILGAVNEREEKISESLDLAEKTKKEMETLQAQNENLLKEARAERDSMIKDAKETANKMVEEAKGKAKDEAEKVMTSARESINAEKAAAITELKTQVASLSISIAEKVVKNELDSKKDQLALVEKMLGDVTLN